jgi:ethanolamine transporter EutH
MKSALTKTIVRNAVVFGGVVVTSARTWASEGNSLGFNKQTALGIALGLVFPIGAVLHRYFDKTDPAFGKVIDLAEIEATKEIKKSLK